MSLAAGALPRVTVCIPLYRSRPFLDVIRENVRCLRYPELEIIVSDRHGLDDAVDVLEREFGDDARFSFRRATDGAGWVAHFNDLMRVARGEYFVWMQHDDSFPEGYVETLVASAQEVPLCLIAFGHLSDLWLNPAEHQRRVPLGRFCGPGAWRRGSADRLLFSGWIGVPFRGLIHRSRALAVAGPMRDTPGSLSAEQVWIYALALTGPFVFTTETHCVKRFHDASVTARSRRSASAFWAGAGVLAQYLERRPTGRRVPARIAFSTFTLMRIVYHGMAKRFGPGTARALRDGLYLAVNGRPRR